MKKSLTALVVGGVLSLGLTSLPSVYSSASSELLDKKMISVPSSPYLVPEPPLVALLATGVTLAALYRKRR